MSWRAHLTIDLDYWTMWDNDSVEGVKVLNRLKKLNVPTAVVRYHQHVVKYITDDIWHLINVDTHDDYPQAVEHKLYEGNWASPVFLPRVERYTWFTNSIAAECSDYRYANTCCFRYFKKRQVQDLVKALPWNNIMSASICLSPNWAQSADIYSELRQETFKLFGKPKRNGQAHAE